MLGHAVDGQRQRSCADQATAQIKSRLNHALRSMPTPNFSNTDQATAAVTSRYPACRTARRTRPPAPRPVPPHGRLSAVNRTVMPRNTGSHHQAGAVSRSPSETTKASSLRFQPACPPSADGDGGSAGRRPSPEQSPSHRPAQIADRYRRTRREQRPRPSPAIASACPSSEGARPATLRRGGAPAFQAPPRTASPCRD